MTHSRRLPGDSLVSLDEFVEVDVDPHSSSDCTRKVNTAELVTAAFEEEEDPLDFDRPIAARPISARPISARPIAARPISARPISARPIAARPMAARPVAVGPASARPARPAAPRPGAARPAIPPPGAASSAPVSPAKPMGPPKLPKRMGEALPIGPTPPAAPKMRDEPSVVVDEAALKRQVTGPLSPLEAAHSAAQAYDARFDDTTPPSIVHSSKTPVAVVIEAESEAEISQFSDATPVGLNPRPLEPASAEVFLGSARLEMRAGPGYRRWVLWGALAMASLGALVFAWSQGDGATGTLSGVRRSPAALRAALSTASSGPTRVKLWLELSEALLRKGDRAGAFTAANRAKGALDPSASEALAVRVLRQLKRCTRH